MPGTPGCSQLSMPQPAHRPLQLPLQPSLVACPVMPCGKSCKQRLVGQALQTGPDLDLVTGSIPSVSPPAGEGARQGLVGEAVEGLLQGHPVVVASVAGVLPGIEGAQQGGVGQLGQGLLKSLPVEALALYGGTPCPEHLCEQGRYVSYSPLVGSIRSCSDRQAVIQLRKYAGLHSKLLHTCSSTLSTKHNTVVAGATSVLSGWLSSNVL